MPHSVHRVTVLQTLAAIGAVTGLASGCSFIFHADATQCQTDGDCRARGGVFVSSNFVRCSAGMCVQPDDGGTQDASSSSSSEAGAPACNTFSDCPTPTGNHSEVTCNPDSHTCVQLTTDQCPVVLGDYQYSKNVAPVVIGAFSLLPTMGGDLTSHPCTRNYLLAIDEFTNSGSGIPAGPNGKLRMPVIVVCDTTSSAIDQSMQHLTGDLDVHSVIAALDSADLKVLFNNYGYNTSANVFVVNPYGADSTLTALARGQQFWHMLGVPGDTAPAYEPLLARVEGYVRNNAPWMLGSSGTLKVSTVTANATVLNDLASAVLPTLSWNRGSDQAVTGDPAFDSETIPDSVLNGATSPNISDAAAGILAFLPQVVVSFASDEFVTLLQTVELQWPSSVPRPVWILSSYNYESQPLLTWVGSDSTKLNRVLGVNVASTTQTQVLTQYNSDFLAANPGLTTDYNNCYDATYFAVDSLIAASPFATRPFTGDQLGGGMLRLIAPTGTAYNMGPTAVNGVSAALTGTSSASIKLVGTLGDPQFNNNTGARVGQGDVYCIPLETTPPPTPYYQPDAMRLSVPADGGTPTLSGTPCFTGL